MTTQKTISPNEYKSAQRAIENIKPVLTAFQRVDAETLQGDVESIATFQSFKRFMTKLHDKHQAIINIGNEMYKNRPATLIDRAASRLLNQIPHEIELEQKGLEARINTRKIKADELMKKQFSQAEISQIIPEIGQAEIDTSSAIITALKTEAEAIKAFLADSPRYSIELLKNTQLSQSEEAA